MTTSPKPTCFKIDLDNEKMYYNSKDLNEYNPEFYYGCKSKPKTIIVKKKIPESEYVYANLKLSEWKLTSADCKKSQLLISKEWVDKYYFKVEPVTIREVERNDESVVVENVGTIEETKEDEIEKAPPLLHLKDEEKFKDCDGNIIEIETRGEKSRNKIYFKVKDVSRVFDMSRLQSSLTDSRSEYKNIIHYKIFFNRVNRVENASNTIKKSLYLTYKGLLRVLFASNSKYVEQFQDWAEEKLFTIQMGSKEEKIKLGTDVLNISIKTYKAVFDTYASKFPCIYLLSLGKVKDLRETFGIDASVPDDSIVYKFGFTDDLERRLGEHQTKYGKLKNVNINLACFHTVDVKYTSEAEAKIREMTRAYNSLLNIDGYNELISLNKIQFEFIIELYESTGRKYMGNTAGLQKEIEDLKKEIQSLHDEIKDLKLQFNMEIKDKETQFIIGLKDKDKELLEKDLIIQKEIHEKNTLKTQLETNEIIYNLKLQLASK